MGGEQRVVDNERLLATLAAQDQKGLCEIVDRAWTARGWEVEQVDDVGLLARKDGEKRNLLVTVDGIGGGLRDAIERSETPVTVVSMGSLDPKAASWARRDDTTSLLDAEDVVRLCVQEDIVEEVFGPVERSESAEPDERSATPEVDQRQAKPGAVGGVVVPAVAAFLTTVVIGQAGTFNLFQNPSVVEGLRFVLVLFVAAIFKKTGEWAFSAPNPTAKRISRLVLAGGVIGIVSQLIAYVAISDTGLGLLGAGVVSLGTLLGGTILATVRR